MEAKILIQTGLENVKGSIERTLEGLTPAELKWQPRPDANSIGLILFHIARSEDSFIQSLLQGKSQLWESGKWYQKLNKAIDDRGAHYTAEQVVTFTVPEIKDLLGYMEAVHKLSLGYLKTLTADKLDEKVNLPPMGPPPKAAPGEKAAPPRRPPFEPTVGTMLLLTIIHAAQHAGEISYLRGLKRGMDK
jgi:hypothetical protein